MKNFHNKRNRFGSGLRAVGLCAVTGGIQMIVLATAHAQAVAPVEKDVAPKIATSTIGPVRLLLPSVIYLAPGREANLYFDNVVLAPPGRALLFNVDAVGGKHQMEGWRQQQERWTWTPTAEDAGEYPLTLEVRDLDDRVVATGITKLHVAPANAGAGKNLSLLCIGDSLTNASVYTDELLKLAAEPNNFALKLLGTRKGVGAEGNFHEGYGGWRFIDFVEKNQPADPAAPARVTVSPFVFVENGKAKFDFPRYVREKLGGTAPDAITIFLGCNDNFGATDETIETSIDTMMNYADLLLAGIRAGAPNAKIGIVTLVPPAASQDAFGANYFSNQTRWQYRKNQHRVVDRMKLKFDGREKENLWLIPAFINLDSVHNYGTSEAPVNARNETKVRRANNGVHPAAEGYRQIADSIFGWLKTITE